MQLIHNVVLVFAAEDLWQRPNRGITSYGRPSINRTVPTVPVSRYPYWMAGSPVYIHDQWVQLFDKLFQDMDVGRLNAAIDEPLEYICPLIGLAVQNISSNICKLGETFKLLSVTG